MFSILNIDFSIRLICISRLRPVGDLADGAIIANIENNCKNYFANIAIMLTQQLSVSVTVTKVISIKDSLSEGQPGVTQEEVEHGRRNHKTKGAYGRE